MIILNRCKLTSFAAKCYLKKNFIFFPLGSIHLWCQTPLFLWRTTGTLSARNNKVLVWRAKRWEVQKKMTVDRRKQGSCFAGVMSGMFVSWVFPWASMHKCIHTYWPVCVCVFSPPGFLQSYCRNLCALLSFSSFGYRYPWCLFHHA